MATAAPKSMTLAEFLVWDDGTDARYELVEGRVRRVPLCPEIHGALLVNVGSELRAHLRPSLIGAIRGGIVPPHRADTYYLADVIVTRGPLKRNLQYFPEPVLIAEIAAAEEVEHDALVKLPDYRRLPSVREILLVWSEGRRVQVFRRWDAGWAVEDLAGDDTELVLAATDSPIPLRAIYRDLPV